MENDPVLNAIDERVNAYSEKMAAVSEDFQKLFKQAGTTTRTEEEEREEKKAAKGQQKIADETARRTAKIKEYSIKVSQAVAQAELDIRQAKIDTMKDGFDKAVAQVNLNYDRLVAENKKRETDMIEDLKDKMALEWLDKNPKAAKEQQAEYRASLNLTAADLAPEQRNMLQAYSEAADEMRRQGNKEALEEMLADVMTYEQQRLKIAEEYEEKRNALYEKDKDGNVTATLRQGVTRGNAEELNLQEQNALQAIDEQFAQREDTYKAWCEEIADMTIEELEKALADAKKALEEAEKSGTGGTGLAAAKAKVNTAEKSLSQARAENEAGPGKRGIKEWEDLYTVLQECGRGVESIGDTVGGVAGEIISSAGGILASTLSMIDGIVTLVDNSSMGIQATSKAAANAIATVEKASVILTVISSALQIATAIANMFNNDNKKQEEIERLQERIDQLQWELDNADIVRLQQNSGKAIDRVRQALSETRAELIRDKLAVNDVAGAFRAWFQNVSKNQELLAKSAQKIADAYADIAYSADKALGEEKYENAQEQLKNIAQQQILINEQIRNEQSKKDTDNSKIGDWERQIEELGAQAVAIINDMVEDIIGGSAADIAGELGDAFFEAFQSGEDYAEAWGAKVKEIVGDIVKRMLVQKYLEDPLGEIFDKYKNKWFANGQFAGLQVVMDSMSGFANDLNAVGGRFEEIWEALPDSVKDMIGVAEEATREASGKGIAAASQESVDELNGRATAIQGHTCSISENTKLLLATANLILQSVMNIESNTEGLSTRMANIEDDVRDMRGAVNDISLKGIKIKN